MVILLLALLGVAADTDAPVAKADPPEGDAPTATEPAEDPDDEDDGAEIVVYGEHLVEQARQAVKDDLVRQGFEEEIRKDGYTIFRHGNTWKGEVQVHDDGWIRMKRQPVQFKPPANSKLGWATCIAIPFCVRAGGQSVSKRKHMAQRRRTLGDVEPLARMYGDRVADLHVDEQLDTLPDRLTALWNDGAPLDGKSPALPTIKQRKAALLSYWESRTETIWGFRVRAAVEAFIREEVQYSPFPFTRAEIATFNTDRHTETPLDLERPWELVLADLEERAGQ